MLAKPWHSVQSPGAQVFGITPIPLQHMKTIFRTTAAFLSAGFFFSTLSIQAGTLVGGGGEWTVRQVNGGSAPGSPGVAQLLLNGLDAVAEVSTSIAQIDYGSGGEFAVDNTFPGLVNTENSYAVEAFGTIDVTSAGDITFGVFADDFARLSIDGVVVVESSGNAVTTVGSVNLSAGLHSVEVLYYEGTGSESLEVFIATTNGAFASFAAATWELLDVVSDPAATDITVSGASFPVNAGTGAVAATLAASGGDGTFHSYELVYPLDVASPVNLLPAGSNWTYLDDGTLPTAQAVSWTESGYDDSLWMPAAPAPLGYSDADVITTISNGTATTRHAAYYFRSSFSIASAELPFVDKLRVLLNRDDSAAVYINGTEVVRDSLPAGVLDNTTLASVITGGFAEDTYFEYEVDESTLVAGVNTIAVEVHQGNLTSSDVIFDLALEYDRRAAITGDEQFFEMVGNQLLLGRPAAFIPATVGDTYDITVRAINEFGASYQETFDVTVSAASSNASPTAIALDNSTVVDSAPVGTVVGLLSATDADAGDLHSFTLLSSPFFPDTASFSLAGNQLLTDAALDASVKSSYSVRVQATDSTGNSFDTSVVVTVLPAPSRILITPDTLPENAPDFAVVGNLSTVDPVTPNHSYRLVVDLDPTPLPLINFGDTWRYLDDGSDQGTAWTDRLFDDSSWSSGSSPLGYGVLSAASPATTLNFGPDADNKFATTYFRGSFNVVNPDLIDELSFDMALDDGAVVYINGIEVARLRAATADSFDDYTGLGDGGETTNDTFTIAGALPELLIGGTNSIAVEVHQSGPTSSDLWLDMSLQASVRVGGADEDHFYLVGDQIRINKEVVDIPAATGDSFSLTIESISDLDEVITEEVIVSIGPASNSAPTDIALDNLNVDEELPGGSLVGNLSSTDPDGGGFSYSLPVSAFFPDNALFDIVGNQLVTRFPLDVDDAPTRTVRITTTDNTGLSFSETFTIAVNFVQQAPTAVALDMNSFAFDDPVGTAIGTFTTTDENEAEVHTYSFGAFPDIPGTPILPFGSVWSYLDDGSNQGTAWAGNGFDDSSWASGAAELGYGDNDEATVVAFIDTQLDADPATVEKNATTYFRHALTIATADPRGYSLNVKYDDAAAVYINGTEVFRSANLADGALFNEYSTALGDGFSGPQMVPAGVIVSGINVIAVEIHQNSATSSDISMDFELSPMVASPYASYFAINGDQLETAVDFTTVGIAPPFTFDLPLVSTDPAGNPVLASFSVDMIGGSADSDIDGLADAWEIANFGDLSQGAGGDADNDGATNGEEYGADTDPNDAADFLQISAINVSVFGPQVVWPAKPNRTYAVYWSPDLQGGNWILLQSGLTTAVAGNLTANDTTGAPMPGERFYRVEAEAPAP